MSQKHLIVVYKLNSQGVHVIYVLDEQGGALPWEGPQKFWERSEMEVALWQYASDRKCHQLYSITLDQWNRIAESSQSLTELKERAQRTAQPVQPVQIESERSSLISRVLGW